MTGSFVERAKPRAPDFTIHPYAEIFPLAEGEQREAFRESIARDGVKKPIVLIGDAILDGRTRYLDACAAGIPDSEIPWRQFGDEPGDGDDPLEFVVRENLDRRHLDDDQRRMVAARLVTLGRGRPRADIPANGGISVARAAQLAHADEAGTERARTVVTKGTSALQAAVDAGQASVRAAAEIAALPEPEQAKIIEEIARSPETKRAYAGVARKLRAERQAQKAERRAEREAELGSRQRALPEKKYGFILADPEWDRTTYSDAGMDRHAANHYPVSSDEVIASRDVASIAAPDCVCGLWCTDPHRGVDVLRAWGFEPKSYFVWVKDIVEIELTPEQKNTGLGDGRYLMVIGPPGTGFWNRDRDELFLIGTRGKPVCPAQGTQGESVWFAARGEHARSRDDAHSDKPEICFEWIERHFPNTPKIELNRRGPARPGWDAWGNEATESQANASAGDANREAQASASAGMKPLASRLADGRTSELAVETSASTASDAGQQERERFSEGVTAGETAPDDGLDIPPFLRRTEALPAAG